MAWHLDRMKLVYKRKLKACVLHNSNCVNLISHSDSFRGVASIPQPHLIKSSLPSSFRPMATTNILKNSDHPIIKHDNQDLESQETQEDAEVTFDYAKRAQWLRAALLGANDGLLSTASIMMGVGAVTDDVKTMILSGIATLLGGACSMAIGEFVSVYSQYDIEMSQIKREIKSGMTNGDQIEEKKSGLPSPTKAAIASATAFAMGAVVPLLAAAFIRNYHVRLVVVVATVSLTLIGFGGLSAILGRAPMVKSTLRILIGGWVAMGVTFASTKAVSFTGLINT